VLIGAARSGSGIAVALLVVSPVILVTASPALASHDKTDVVTTDDGGVYVGEIKSVQYATLNLNTDPAGLISIEWRHVTGLTSKFEYRVELSGGDQHLETLGTPKEPGQLNIVTLGGPIEVDLTEVVSVVPVEQGFWKALDGSINFGLTYTQANNAFQYNLSADADRRSRRHYSAVSAQSIFNIQQGDEATSQHYLKFLLTQITKKKWGPFEMGQLQSNPDQGYDLRLLVGGGTSSFFIERSTELLALNLGVVYNREEVTGGSDVDESAEALAGVAFRRFKRGSHSPSVQLSLMTFTTLNETHRFRTVFNFNVGWKIIGDFKFSCQINNSYDSQPPGTDADNNDISVVTSVGYTF
jgi:ABC-type molybdate transport system substrate-binding protein